MTHVAQTPNSGLIPKLLLKIRHAFNGILDHRHPNKREIPLVDGLMSGLAVFLLKFPSLLKFDQQRQEQPIRHNLESLFGIRRAPCDTQLRDMLDPVKPEDIHSGYRELFQFLKESGELESFRYLNGYYVIAVDGTKQFSSTKIHCSECARKTMRNGVELYYHYLMAGAFVHPRKKAVLPVIPEPIHRHDGDTKNDCELGSSKRLLTRVRQDFPDEPIIVVEDGLFANGPNINFLKRLRYSFIISVKEGDHEHLFKWVAEQEEKENVRWIVEHDDKDSLDRTCRFINDAELNKTHPIKVNFIEYTEKRAGKPDIRFSWITDIRITEHNWADIVCGGRVRWKIENETFNTLKNQGYHLEHNYGHGKQHLSTNFALLMMLAFLIDQIQELGCALFQKARQRSRSRTSLWSRMRALFVGYFIEDWETYWRSIAYGHQATQLKPKEAPEFVNTS